MYLSLQKIKDWLYIVDQYSIWYPRLVAWSFKLVMLLIHICHIGRTNLLPIQVHFELFVRQISGQR